MLDIFDRISELDDPTSENILHIFVQEADRLADDLPENPSDAQWEEWKNDLFETCDLTEDEGRGVYDLLTEYEDPGDGEGQCLSFLNSFMILAYHIRRISEQRLKGTLDIIFKPEAVLSMPKLQPGNRWPTGRAQRKPDDI